MTLLGLTAGRGTREGEESLLTLATLVLGTERELPVGAATGRRLGEVLCWGSMGELDCPGFGLRDWVAGLVGKFAKLVLTRGGIEAMLGEMRGSTLEGELGKEIL